MISISELRIVLEYLIKFSKNKFESYLIIFKNKPNDLFKKQKKEALI